MPLLPEIKKFGPIAIVALVGITASELVTKDKGTLYRVVGAALCGTATLIAAAKFKIITV